MLKQRKLKRGIRLFADDRLDALSRVHPAMPAVVFGPLAAAMIGRGIYSGVPWYHAAWLILVGYVIWCFAEYAIHRWFFHFHPRRAWLKRAFYYVHEHHHHFQEEDRLVAPPLMAAPFFVAFLVLFYLTIGLPFGSAPMWIVWGGCGIGGILYETMHYYLHFAQPRSPLGRYLRRCHLQHHFVCPDNWFGVSCPWVDYLFRTHLKHDQIGTKCVPQETTNDLPPLVQAYLRQTTDAGPASRAVGK